MNRSALPPRSWKQCSEGESRTHTPKRLENLCLVCSVCIHWRFRAWWLPHRPCVVVGGKIRWRRWIGQHQRRSLPFPLGAPAPRFSLACAVEVFINVESVCRRCAVSLSVVYPFVSTSHQRLDVADPPYTSSVNMGNIPGMPQMPIEDINACAKEVLTTFTPIYAKSYAIGLIDKLKAEAEAKAASGDDADTLQLRDPPVPDEWLKEGFLVKQGAVKKNWKKRWFVATNKADNFRILYFEKEALKSDFKKAKGEIAPCNYRVKLLDKEEEKKDFGEFAWMLKPYGRRRKWYIRLDGAAEDKEELRKEWVGVFKYAARYADAPLNTDPVMRFAFKRAYRMTRWRLGVWGWFRYDRTEEEQLGQMIVDRCEADCMRPVYDAIPGGRLERKIRAQVQDGLDKTVGAAVGAAWKVAVQGIESQKETLESKARENLGPIFEKQAELSNTVKDKIVGIVSPALEEISKHIMTPICSCLMGPLVHSYKKLVLSYHKRMTTIISESSSPEELEKGLAYFTRQIRWWWGPMRPALREIYRAFREGYEDDEPESSGFTITVNIGDILDCFQGVRPWQVEDAFESRLRETMGAAIFTFADEVANVREGGAEPDLNKILQQVTRMMVHDAHILVRKAVTDIFIMVIQPPFKKKVDPLIKDILEPLSSAIPEPLKVFLDIDKLAIGCMDNILTETITNCVKPASKPVLTMLDSLQSDLSLGE